MSGFSMADWAGFLSTEAQAAAGLAGLIFVALSINLPRILATDGLPERAAESVIMLVGVLIVCSNALVPDRTQYATGQSFFSTGAIMWLLPSYFQLKAARRKISQPLASFAARIVLTQLATLPFVIAGVLLMKGDASGLDWLATGAGFCFIASTINAWVLLVEILR